MNNVMAQIRRVAAAEVLTSLPARRVFAVLTFTMLTAFSAHVAAPLPGTAVPVSLQTLMVLLSGMLLGPALGAAAQTAYLMAGMAGLPVFAAGMGVGYLFGPTGGYLLAFPAAAAVAGAVAARGIRGVRGIRGIRDASSANDVNGASDGNTAARVAVLALAALLATLTVYAGGWAQLTLLTGDGSTALRLGILPFILGDLVKLVLAVAIAMRVGRRTLALL